ncbi:sulfotransferase, partial [Gammaproteobacteria bacterium]|nr:sulfotransferase [Gammaproteobacteria bacterium]
WKELLGDKVFSINYQDLTKNQESSTRDLLKFCGLGWEEGCLQFHKTKRDVKTASAVQVRQPMYTKSVDLWKKYEIQLEGLLDDLKRLNVL